MAPPSKAFPISLAFAAAILWATYYPFILWLSPNADGAILAFPFLFGGVPFLLLALVRWPASGGHLHKTLTNPAVLLAGVLLGALQADVILATRLAGAVTTSILTLLGDVALIPAMNYAFWHEGGDRVMRWIFWVGIAIAAIGGTLSIVGEGGLARLSEEAWLLALPLPFLVGGYFVLVARISSDMPMESVVGSASLVAFGLGSLGALFVVGSGGFPGPLDLSGWAVLALIGITTFFIAPWSFFESARRVTVVVPAVINGTIPIFTLVFVVVLLNEHVSAVAAVGVPLAFLGAAIALVEPVSPRSKRAS